MIRKGIRARIRPALDIPGGAGLRRVYPFRRSWIAITVVAVFDAVFIIPAMIVFGQAADGWSRFENLFDLVAALFSSAWLLGWSIGPLTLTAILLLMLFGRETIKVERGRLRLFIGLPLLGLAADYSVGHMRNLRVESPPKKSGKSWRGAHFVFDYGANTVAFGSDIDPSTIARLEEEITAESGVTLRSGEATPEELEGQWAPSLTETISPADPEPAPGPREAVRWSSPSTLVLILANLVPVAGTVYLGWNLGEVMVLYWAESGIIGFYNVCKMAVISRWAGALSGVFFVAHYGAFMSVHFLFIYMLFVKGPQDTSGGDLEEVGKMFFALWPALAALFVSHGISFFQNFIGRREYAGRTIKRQMSEPYSRIVAMHLVLIFGGGLVLALGSPTPVLLLVIAGKIVFDVRAHLRERSRS